MRDRPTVDAAAVMSLIRIEVIGGERDGEVLVMPRGTRTISVPVLDERPPRDPNPNPERRETTRMRIVDIPLEQRPDGTHFMRWHRR